jgi:hypothetical protein
MPSKKISELELTNSIQDTDLLIVETSDGTKAIKKSDITKIKTGTINLSANNWIESDTIFTQTITIANTTANSKIDLQPNNMVLTQLINDNVSALYVENNDGVFIVYAIGSFPTVDLNIQITITEVE